MVPLLDQAISRRRQLRLGDTNALRLVDGEGDDLPGIYLDDFAGRWLVSTTKGSLPASSRDWFAAQDRTIYWKNLGEHERESPGHLFGPPQEEPFTIRENSLLYQVRFQSGYSQGIFLDQRENRLRVRQLAKPGHTVLNTFAYTGAFSVAAALGGAVTTTLDLSQPYLDWARENLQLNGLEHGEHFFIKGDTFHWLRRFAKQGRRFNGIVLDPPTFSRDDKGNVFRVEKDYGHLVELAAACLHNPGWLLCTTNHRGSSMRRFHKTIRASIPRSATTEAQDMPPDFTGEQYLKTVLVQL